VPLVEALRLDGPAGTAIVLLNWNDWADGQTANAVKVFVAGAAGKSVVSVEGNKPQWQSVGSNLNITVPMKNVDILLVN
jgi:hypothetical protein